MPDAMPQRVANEAKDLVLEQVRALHADLTRLEGKFEVLAGALSAKQHLTGTAVDDVESGELN
jgi:hypothetical protein